MTIFSAISTFLLILAIGAPASGQPTEPPPPPLVKENATVKLSDHVYVIPDGNVGGVPNVGIIVGSKGTLIVDTGLGPRNMETVLRETAKVSRNAELYLVATHFHPEHAGGSSALPANAKFIVARVQQQDIEELGPGMMKTFAGMSPLHAELLNNVQFRKPDLLFDSEDPAGSRRRERRVPRSWTDAHPRRHDRVRRTGPRALCGRHRDEPALPGVRRAVERRDVAESPRPARSPPTRSHRPEPRRDGRREPDRAAARGAHAGSDTRR